MDRIPDHLNNPNDRRTGTSTNFPQGLIYSLGHMGLGPNMAPSRYMSASMQPPLFQHPLTRPGELHESIAHQVMNASQSMGMIMTAPQAQISQAQAPGIHLGNFPLTSLQQPSPYVLPYGSPNHAVFPQPSSLNLTPRIANSMPFISTHQNSRKQRYSIKKFLNLKGNHEQKSEPAEETKKITILKRKKDTVDADVSSEVVKSEMEQKSDLQPFHGVIDDTNENESNQGNTVDQAETHFSESFPQPEDSSSADAETMEQKSTLPKSEGSCTEEVCTEGDCTEDGCLGGGCMEGCCILNLQGRKKGEKPGSKRQNLCTKIFPKGTRHKVKKKYVPKRLPSLIVDEEISEKDILRMLDSKFLALLGDSTRTKKSDTIETTVKVNPLPISEEVLDVQSEAESQEKFDHEVSARAAEKKKKKKKKKKKAVSRKEIINSNPIDDQLPQPMTKTEASPDSEIPKSSSTENCLSKSKECKNAQPDKKAQAKKEPKRGKDAQVSSQVPEGKIEQNSDLEGFTEVVYNKKKYKKQKEMKNIDSAPVDPQFSKRLEPDEFELTKRAVQKNSLLKPKEELKGKQKKKGARASDKTEVAQAKNSSKATKLEIANSESATLSNEALKEVEKSSNQDGIEVPLKKKTKPLNPNAKPFVMPSTSKYFAETSPQMSSGSITNKNPNVFVGQGCTNPLAETNHYSVPSEPQIASESNPAYEKRYSGGQKSGHDRRTFGVIDYLNVDDLISKMSLADFSSLIAAKSDNVLTRNPLEFKKNDPNSAKDAYKVNLGQYYENTSGMPNLIPNFCFLYDPSTNEKGESSDDSCSEKDIMEIGELTTFQPQFKKKNQVDFICTDYSDLYDLIKKKCKNVVAAYPLLSLFDKRIKDEQKNGIKNQNTTYKPVDTNSQPKVNPQSTTLSSTQEKTCFFNGTSAPMNEESKKERSEEEDVDDLLRVCMPPFDDGEELQKLMIDEPLMYQLLKSGIPVEKSTVAQTFRKVKDQAEHLHNPEKCFQCQYRPPKKMKPQYQQNCEGQHEEPKSASCVPNVNCEIYEPTYTSTNENPLALEEPTKTCKPTEICPPEANDEIPQQSSRRNRKFNRLSANQQKKMNRNGSSNLQKENIAIQIASNFTTTSKPQSYPRSQKRNFPRCNNSSFRKPFVEVSGDTQTCNSSTANPHETKHIERGRSVPQKKLQKGATQIQHRT